MAVWRNMNNTWSDSVHIHRLHGLSVCLLLPCPEFKQLLPRDTQKARKFLRATSIGHLVSEESNKQLLDSPAWRERISLSATSFYYWTCIFLWLWNPPTSLIGRAWQAHGFPVPIYSLQLSPKNINGQNLKGNTDEEEQWCQDGGVLSTVSPLMI